MRWGLGSLVCEGGATASRDAGVSPREKMWKTHTLGWVPGLEHVEEAPGQSPCSAPEPLGPAVSCALPELQWTL